MKQDRTVSIGSLIAKAKNGLVLLSQMATALGLGAGIAGLFVALQRGASLPWVSDRDSSSRIVCYVGGLDNNGNNCFLNVILQALSSCSSFLLYLKSILECENMLCIDKTQELPLVHALILLLEELSILRDEKIVLSPKRVMAALSLYTTDFNLTRQQDAAEALLHLLNALKREILLCYEPHGSSLSKITGFASRVYKKEMGYGLELDQWKKIIVGPFDGTLRSMLTCSSCSSVLSMDYEHFNCLPLSPVLNQIGDTTDDCCLVDCLKHFSKSELLENYRCDRCWHISALKYLSLKSETDEGKVNQLRDCVNHDNCSCPYLFQNDEIMWSGYSRASKQLTLNHCPKILSIHLQRALMSITGEFVKHEGHISFPFVLDLSSFANSASTLQNEDALPKKPLIPNILKILEGMTSMGERGSQKINIGSTSQIREVSQEIQENNYSEDTVCSTKSCMYSLCTVVEHYGRYGGGHYAAYRRAPPVHDHNLDVEGSKRLGDSKWFYVSDQQVLEVSEEAVLSANAALLFYERI